MIVSQIKKKKITKFPCKKLPVLPAFSRLNFFPRNITFRIPFKIFFFSPHQLCFNGLPSMVLTMLAVHLRQKITYSKSTTLSAIPWYICFFQASVFSLPSLLLPSLLPVLALRAFGNACVPPSRTSSAIPWSFPSDSSQVYRLEVLGNVSPGVILLRYCQGNMT